jgi:hypothetical protein
MAKLPLNPPELQQSNPLIESMPEDTFGRVNAVLSLLQDYFGHKAGDDMPDAAKFGGFLVFDVVQDAIKKQVEALARDKSQRP